MDIVDDMMPSTFLTANFTEIYACYLRVCMITSNHNGVLSLLFILDGDAPASKTQGISYIEDPGPFISSENNVLLKIQNSDAFGKNNYTSVSPHANVFYRHSMALLDEIHV